MKLFIDTAIIKEIEWAKERGLIDGILTNPTLLTKTDRKLSEVVRDILARVKDSPVGIELVSENADEILEEAKAVSKLGKNVIVNVPMTDEGMLALPKLEAKGMRTNVTLVFSLAQALIAARAGATFVSIMVGQLDDNKKDGLKVLSETIQVFKQYELKTMVIATSLFSVRRLEEAALAGADAASVPFKVMVQMFRHELTDKGVKQFLADWEKIPK